MTAPTLDMEGLPPEVAEAIKELTAAVERDRLDTMLSIVTQDLGSAGLPTEQGVYEVKDEDGTTSESLGLIALVKRLGFEDFSPEYFQAWIVTYIEAVRWLRAQGEIDTAILAAWQLGSVLLAEEEYHEPTMEGQRAWRNQAKAAIATWGTQEERFAKRKLLIALYEEAVENGAKTEQEAYQAAARKARSQGANRVSARTVRRAVTGQ